MKILVMTKNWVGDMLFQLPAIQQIRDQFPEAEITVVTPMRCKDLVEGQPTIRKVITFDEKKEHRFFLKRWAFAFRLRQEKFDRVYLFHRSRTRAMLTWLAGIPIRIGYASDRKAWLTEAIAEPAGKIHEVDYFLNLVHSGSPSIKSDEVYRLELSEKDRKTAEKKIETLQRRPFVCFHLGANWEPKRWPPAHFAQLADQIAEHSNFQMVVTGGPQDAPLESAMRKCLKKAEIFSLIGQTHLKELAAVFQQAKFVVSGDSGPMHIASAVGAPVLALFGPTDPDRTGPRGAGPVKVLHFVPPGYSVPWYGQPHELPREGWLAQISADQVFEAIREQGWLS